ncbi:hypothetical protein TWF481_012013 [Arthrobotrys musiformis]|uniref:Uncharacterized protein n=1 Tax=Arthrobotrys musiformis TaxID=47236 RepID=A0AAV9VVX7_9PEZI
MSQNANSNGDRYTQRLQKLLPKLIQDISQGASEYNAATARALQATITTISVMATCIVAPTSDFAVGIELQSPIL